MNNKQRKELEAMWQPKIDALFSAEFKLQDLGMYIHELPKDIPETLANALEASIVDVYRHNSFKKADAAVDEALKVVKSILNGDSKDDPCKCVDTKEMFAKIDERRQVTHELAYDMETAYMGIDVAWNRKRVPTVILENFTKVIGGENNMWLLRQATNATQNLINDELYD